MLTGLAIAAPSVVKLKIAKLAVRLQMCARNVIKAMETQTVMFPNAILIIVQKAVRHLIFV